jgi:hypothetical protein
MAEVLAYLASAVIAAWGVSHVIPTGRVVAGILVAFAVVTGFTGARTPIIWSKVLPGLLGGAAALLVAASVV